MSSYPRVTSYLSSAGTAQFLTAVDALMEAHRDETIHRGIYEELRKTIIGRFDDAFAKAASHSICATDIRTLGDEEAERLILSMAPAFHRIDAQIVTLEQTVSELRLKRVALDLLREIKPVADILTAIRSYTQPAPSRAAREIVKYTPLGPTEAARRMACIVEAVLDASRDSMLAIIRGSHERFLNDFLVAQVQSHKRGDVVSLEDYYGTPTSPTYSLRKFDIVSGLVVECSRRSNLCAIMRGDKDRLIHAQAEATFAEIQEVFLQKNMAKLMEIVSLKDNLCSIRVLGRQVDHRSLFCNLSFMFADRCSFRVRSGLLWSSDRALKPAYRSTVTFHNVRMNDGTVLRYPSETKMRSMLTGLRAAA